MHIYIYIYIYIHIYIYVYMYIIRQDTDKTLQMFGASVIVLNKQHERHMVRYFIWAMPMLTALQSAAQCILFDAFGWVSTRRIDPALPVWGLRPLPRECAFDVGSLFYLGIGIPPCLCEGCGLLRGGVLGSRPKKNVRGEIGGWGRVPFNETYAPSLSTIYDGA